MGWKEEKDGEMRTERCFFFFFLSLIEAAAECKMEWPALGKSAQTCWECRALSSILISFFFFKSEGGVGGVVSKTSFFQPPVIPPHDEAASAITFLLSGGHGVVPAVSPTIVWRLKKKMREKLTSLLLNRKVLPTPPSPHAAISPPWFHLMFLVLVLPIAGTSSIMHICFNPALFVSLLFSYPFSLVFLLISLFF